MRILPAWRAVIASRLVGFRFREGAWPVEQAKTQRHHQQHRAGGHEGDHRGAAEGDIESGRRAVAENGKTLDHK